MVLDGFRYVRSSRVLMMLMLVGGVSAVLTAPYSALLPIYQRDILNVGASGLGLLYAASGLGALGSSILLALISPERPSPKQMFVLGIGAGLALAAFSYSASFGLSLGILFMVGLGMSGSTIVNMTLIQNQAPKEMLGRVFSIRMLTWGTVPFGQFLLGLVAQLLSPQIALLGMGLLCAAAMLLLMLRLRWAHMTVEGHA